MRPTQRQLNEFLVDLVEFVQKHVKPPVTRTRILDEDGCAGAVLKHEPSGSVIEITTMGGKVAFRSGETAWTVDAGEGAIDLYGRVVQDLLDVFAGRRVGPWGGPPRAS